MNKRHISSDPIYDRGWQDGYAASSQHHHRNYAYVTLAALTLIAIVIAVIALNLVMILE